MSILQEYERIRKELGVDMYDSINTYSQNENLSFDKIVYNQENFEKFEKWYYEEIKLQGIKIINFWETDYEDYMCNALLLKNDKTVANLIVSIELNKDNKTRFDIEKECKSYINKNFNKLYKLPKITECSDLLTNIYDNVCESEASMCHIDYDDWGNQYSYDYNDTDLDLMEYEISKYNLFDVITIDQDNYKICGYSNLQTKFNDDRFYKNNYKYLKKCKDFSKLYENFNEDDLKKMDNVIKCYELYIEKSLNKKIIKKEYLDSYGNDDLINWYEGLMNTEDFINDYNKDIEI